MSNTVQVTNIAPTTSKKSLEDFFSFCGTVSSLELSSTADGKQTAIITFAKDSAASTATMLHGGSLDGSPLTVSPLGSSTKAAGATSATPASTLGQEDKPRTAVVAELLAHGYALSDEVTKRAIDLDNKHGLTDTFKSYLSQLDRSLGERVVKGTSTQPTTAKTQGTPSGPLANEAASEKDASATPLPGTAAATQDKFTTTVPQADAKHEHSTTQGTAQQPSLVRHIQGHVQSQLDRPDVKAKTDFAWSKMQEYYNAFANHPKIHALYTNASKTVSDVHEEAKRIAEEKKRGGVTGSAGTSAPVTTA